MIVNEADLRVHVFQNAVSWAIPHVRITHMPTGIVATCGCSRSQKANREHAMKALVERLEQRNA